MTELVLYLVMMVFVVGLALALAPKEIVQISPVLVWGSVLLYTVVSLLYLMIKSLF